MWNFVTSFFGKPNEDLSLESACNILKPPEPDKNILDNSSDLNNVYDNVVSNKIGSITQMTTKKIVIDNLYPCDKNDQPYEIGQKVMYDLILSDGRERVLNVSVVESEWDLSATSSSLWNSRIIICKVEKRVDRNLYLSPGDLVIDMNKMSLDFLPIVGDWLEVDVKSAVNENVINLTGKILEINDISPVRPHIETGKITHWNDTNFTGTMNKTIFFNKESLYLGYVPIIGDKVVAEIIESEQNRCTWRALKIIPEYMQINTDKSDLMKSLKIPKFQDNYPGLIITGLDLSFEKLNTNKKFTISVLNNSNNNLILKNAEFLNSNSQCKIINKIDKEIQILNEKEYNLLCECTARNIGQSKEFLLLSFETFNIGKWLQINVSTNFKRPTGFYESKPMYKQNEPTGNQVLKIQKGTRFQSVQIPYYTVPKKLLDTVSKYDQRSLIELIEELRVLKPVLFNNLMYTNYEDKFHTLIHLDEISNLLALQCFNQDRACFIPNGEHLMLEIENLSERRPSIIVGDRILVTDCMKINTTDFEGFVEKVGAKHIFIRFPKLLHEQYNGEDYTINIIPSRSSYRKLHHAVYLAVRNLGPELLFPSKILSSEPQIQFDLNNENISSNSELKAIEKIQLDWYNKNLNVPQQNAVKNILWGKARPLPYVIFGPPGTGKTVTVIETILQIIRLIPHARLLVAAPSNSAADLIAVRLIDSGILKPGDLIRLVSYNYALSDNIPCKLVPYCATGSSAKEGTMRQDISESGIRLDCNQSMIGRHRITVATCNTSGQLFLMGFPKGHFSHIIVDEAAQATEPDVLTPLSFLDKTSGQIILAGDPVQLGPVVMCKVAEQCGLNESYLERLINRFPYVKDPEGFPDSYSYDPKLVTKLVYNYRSLPDILGLYSSLFYCNELISTIDDETSKEALLVNKLHDLLPKTSSNKLTRILFHGVEGENYQTPDSPSWFNPHEAAQVFFYINELYRLGLNSKNIGIVTPYVKQVKEIRALLTEAEFEMPKVGSVEEFQGQEFDVIILSTVRSHQDMISLDIKYSLGFIASSKRLNVAVSRSKSLLIIIGNPNVLCTDTIWRSVVKYCLEKGCYTGCDLSC